MDCTYPMGPCFFFPLSLLRFLIEEMGREWNRKGPNPFRSVTPSPPFRSNFRWGNEVSMASNFNDEEDLDSDWGNFYFLNEGASDTGHVILDCREKI